MAFGKSLMNEWVDWKSYEVSVEEYIGMDVVIPAFQRGFVWTATNFAMFLIGLASNTVKGSSIIGFTSKDDPEKKIQLNDGLQRTMAIFLAWSDYFEGRNYAELSPEEVKTANNIRRVLAGKRVKPFETKKVLEALKQYEPAFKDNKLKNSLIKFSKNFNGGYFTLRMLEEYNRENPDPRVAALIRGLRDARLKIEVMDNVEPEVAMNVFALMNQNQKNLAMGRKALTFSKDMKFIEIIEDFNERLKPLYTERMEKNEAGITIGLLIARTLTEIKDGKYKIYGPRTAPSTILENITYNYQLQHLSKFVVEVTSLPDGVREKYYRDIESVLNRIAERMLAVIPRNRHGRGRSSLDNVTVLAYIGIGLYLRMLAHIVDTDLEESPTEWRHNTWEEFKKTLNTIHIPGNQHETFEKWKKDTNTQNSKKMRSLFNLINEAMTKVYGFTYSQINAQRQKMRRMVAPAVEELLETKEIKDPILGIPITPGNWQIAHIVPVAKMKFPPNKVYVTITTATGNHRQGTDEITEDYVRNNGGIIIEFEFNEKGEPVSFRFV